MKNELISLLTTFGYEVRQQGSILPNEAYPTSFFTFWNNDTSDQNHYDNDASAFVWDFDVNFYSTDPSLVNSVLGSARTLLRQHGWIVGGKGRDVPSDEPTHTGRAITALYIELNQKEDENVLSE